MNFQFGTIHDPSAQNITKGGGMFNKNIIFTTKMHTTTISLKENE